MLFGMLGYYEEWCGAGRWGIGTDAFGDPSSSLFLPCYLCQPVMPVLTRRICDLKSCHKLNADCAVMSADHWVAWGLVVLAPHWADSSLMSSTSVLPFEK